LNPAGGTVIDLGSGAFNGSGASSTTPILLDFQDSAIAGVEGSSAPNVYTLVEFGIGDTNLSISDFKIENLSLLASETGTLGFVDIGGQEVLQLYVVPEPSTWAMLTLGLGFLIFALRRRMREACKAGSEVADASSDLADDAATGRS
jgi:hypothetical protein